MRPRLLFLALVVPGVMACQGGIDGYDNCAGGQCISPNNNSTKNSNNVNGNNNLSPGVDAGTHPPGVDGAQFPPGKDSGVKPPSKLPDCKKDTDCVPPYVCHAKAGKCVPPSSRNADPCDPIEGIGCTPPKLCISGICLPPPGACTSNLNCPMGYICKNGTCVWGSSVPPGCGPKKPCPSGKLCVNGKCVPKKNCTLPNINDRLKGRWRLDSTLHVRDGLKGFTKGLLSVSTSMNNIITGHFKISGVPSFVSSLVASLLKNTIKKYVPGWAQQVITFLANVDDAIDDTRIISMETYKPAGHALYVGSSEWIRVEFEFKGVKVSSTPQNIPGLGSVKTSGYTAREICGIFMIDRHKIKNAIGKIYRWAVEALITGISCATPNTPCYKSINAMFNDLVNCSALAKAVGGSFGLESVVLAACQSQKQTLVNSLISQLNQLSVSMTFMSLAGQCNVQTGNTFVHGKWYGVLGGTYGNGNFEGTFKGNLQP